ncbi:MAG: transporter substrate-binding domain-containing protein [Bacilli bacterium]
MLKKYNIIVLIFLVLITGCESKITKDIETIDDLNNANIGVFTGSEYDTIINENIKNAKIAYYNSYSDQISALKSNKIAGFLSDEPLAKEMIRKNDGLKILNKKLTNDSYAFAINPKEEELKKEIDEILKKMKVNGKLDYFVNKWIENDSSNQKLETYKEKKYKKNIKYAAVSGSAPFAFMKDNNIIGYDIDVMSYIANELDYKLEVNEMSFDGILPALISGKIDMAGCSIIVTEERKKSVLFSEPDFTGGIVVVVKDNEKD